MINLSFLHLFGTFSIFCHRLPLPHIYHGFVGTMVMLHWKLHSDATFSSDTGHHSVGGEGKIGIYRIISIVHTLIPIVFNFLVETSFHAGLCFVDRSGK